MRLSIHCGGLPWDYKPILRLCSRFCLVVGSCLLAWSAYLWTDARVYEKLESRRFDSVAAGNPSNPPPGAEIRIPKPPRAKIESGSVLGRIEIPRIGVSVMVLEGNSGRIFRRAAGHVEGTAAPGDPGNSAIAAHRDTFFRPLRNIRGQDVIKFTSETRSYLYRVDSVGIVGPDDVEVLADSPEPTLTLITCYPFYYIGSAPKRFVVHARRISSDSLPDSTN